LKQLLYRSSDLKNKPSTIIILRKFLQRQILEKNLKELGNRPLPDRHKIAKALNKKLFKYKDFILYFFINPAFCPKRNGSERPVCKEKVKQKLPGYLK